MKKIIWSFLLAALLITGSFFFLDKQIALFIKKIWLSTARRSFSAANIPDLLLPIVSAVTAIAWVAYSYLVHKGVRNVHTRFFLLVACSVPLAFILKSVLKLVVGRINTRFWLLHPGFKDFQWFHGTGSYAGFPSGHMAVFTALVLALWKFYPPCRHASLGFLSLLGLALIAADYHFLSDVLAGAYLGLAVHASVLYALPALRSTKEGKEIL